MTKTQDRFKLDPLTRCFSDKNEEDAYRAYRFKEDSELYRTAVRFIMPTFGISVTAIAWKLGIHTINPLMYLFWIITITTLFVTLLILENCRITVGQATVLRITAFALGTSSVIASIYVARPERYLPLAGVIYCIMFIVNVQNSSFLFKILLTSLSWAFYTWLGFHKNIPIDANLLLVVSALGIFGIISLVRGFEVEVGNRKEYINDVLLEAERKTSEKLLHNILPQKIAEQLKEKDGSEDLYVEKFESVSVLFADIVGFTGMSKRMDPSELVRTLNHLFSRFDFAFRMHGAEKIKTIGDAYMAVAGLPARCDDHAERIAGLALEIRSAVDK